MPKGVLSDIEQPVGQSGSDLEFLKCLDNSGKIHVKTQYNINCHTSNFGKTLQLSNGDV